MFSDAWDVENILKYDFDPFVTDDRVAANLSFSEDREGGCLICEFNEFWAFDPGVHVEIGSVGHDVFSAARVNHPGDESGDVKNKSWVLIHINFYRFRVVVRVVRNHRDRGFGGLSLPPRVLLHCGFPFLLVLRIFFR